MDIGIAVNISARQFRDEALTIRVSEVLTSTGLPPALLELELTESMLMRDAVRAAAMMEKLKAAGASLAIDDFGTGYSSLSYLKRFPIDKLKIDRSFVMDVPGDPNDTAIVRSIVALAHGLGLQVIAEGAETDAQMEFLRAHGCGVVQGYFVSRPLPAADVPAFISHWENKQQSQRKSPPALENVSA
jgi:EAL domain-containing protein (putative c-di-GMP-specific phosphodiesterase class I)